MAIPPKTKQINITHNGSVYLDDIVLNATKVSEPATLALFGLGLLGAGLNRKRKNA